MFQISRILFVSCDFICILIFCGCGLLLVCHLINKKLILPVLEIIFLKYNQVLYMINTNNCPGYDDKPHLAAMSLIGGGV